MLDLEFTHSFDDQSLNNTITWNLISSTRYLNPHAVALYKDDLFVACDDGMIYVSPATGGNIFKEFGGLGSGPGEFLEPSAIAIGPENLGANLYITDAGNHRIQILDRQDGSPIAAFGCLGSAPGQFRCPSGIAVGKDGKIYVSDTFNHRIQVFSGTPPYYPLICIGGKNNFNELLHYPSGVGVCDDQFLCVLNTFKNVEAHPPASGGIGALEFFTSDLNPVYLRGTSAIGPLVVPKSLFVENLHGPSQIYVADTFNKTSGAGGSKVYIIDKAPQGKYRINSVISDLVFPSSVYAYADLCCVAEPSNKLVKVFKRTETFAPDNRFEHERIL